MSEQPLTFEGIMEYMRETSREMRERSLRSDREFRKMRREQKKRDAEYEREKKDREREWEKRKAEWAKRNAEQAKRNAEWAKSHAAWERRMQKADLETKKLKKIVGALGTRIGKIIEHMVAGNNIIGQFKALGYNVDDYTRNHYFRVSKLGIEGEMDLILHDGDLAILIEVKTSLETADVRKHMEQIEKFRRYADLRWKDPPRYIGAIAGAVVEKEAVKFAHDNGLYVIVQSGKAVEILPTPENFQAKEW